MTNHNIALLFKMAYKPKSGCMVDVTGAAALQHADALYGLPLLPGPVNHTL